MAERATAMSPVAHQGSSAWAWLGDMELDDTLLGLGAAGIFASSAPLAVGFLVNAAHCAEKAQDGSLQASTMYHEKRAFLDAFFGGHFFAILDRYHSAGKVRGSNADLSSHELRSLSKVWGLQDELADWIRCIKRNPPAVLHLVLSGPLLGRGEEICEALEQMLSTPVMSSDGGVKVPRLVLWSYAGSFNLVHSSDSDKQSLKRLLEGRAPQVSSVETTLKSGAWLCDTPRPFWGSSCPTAWTLEAANNNSVGFDISTDIQSVNMFLEEYSGQSATEPQRGVKWIFERIAETANATPAQQGTSVVQLLNELEVRSLETNLTNMVQPSSTSMGKVREALSKDAQEGLDAAYRKAADLLESVRTGSNGGSLEEAVAAAQEYAKLYAGAAGRFLEAGCVEFFPKDKPYSGPRLDKRCILRCMAQGKLQGGPTADVLIVLALLLNLERLDADAVEPQRDVGQETSVLCGMGNWCTTGITRTAMPVSELNACRRVPASTRNLFQLESSTAGPTNAFVVVLAAPDSGMDQMTKSALAPLVDTAIDAIVRGAKLLQAQAPMPAWGKSHSD